MQEAIIVISSITVNNPAHCSKQQRKHNYDADKFLQKKLTNKTTEVVIAR